MPKRVATCRFAEAGAFNGLLFPWPRPSSDFVGKHPLPAPFPLQQLPVQKQQRRQDGISPRRSHDLLRQRTLHRLRHLLAVGSAALRPGAQRRGVPRLAPA
jgi:hypothetical protein